MSRVDDILERLAAVPRGAAAEGELPEDLPAREFLRSPAARLVGRAAAADGLVLARYEHRQPIGVDTEPVWQQGTIPEPKYADFRHDLPIGSFHPGHRAKWSAHELAHVHVGFAWWPGASPLAVATAGRLAELWPVALWYFFDEVGLQRCPRHHGPLFRTLCPACEAVAGARPVEPRDREFVAEGLRFVDRELAAVARTVRTGVPVAHVWGSLDLCSDGIAYADGHGARLEGPAFRAWAERFFVPETGGFGDLPALVARVEAVVAALASDGPLPTWVGDPVVGRRRWVAADLAARLLDAATSDRGIPAEVESWVDGLAEGVDPSEVARQIRAANRPDADPELLFATGYPWEHGGEVPGATLDRLDSGLRTVVPVTLELFDDAGIDPVPAFAAVDEAVRRPLGERFAAWLEEDAPSAVTALARYEAALRHVTSDPLTGLGAVGEGVERASGLTVIRAGFDVVAFAEAVEEGTVEARATDEGLSVGAPEPSGDAVLVARDRSGNLVIALVPDDVAAAIEEDPSRLPDDDLAELLDLQILRRTRFGLSRRANELR